MTSDKALCAFCLHRPPCLCLGTAARPRMRRVVKTPTHKTLRSQELPAPTTAELDLPAARSEMQSHRSAAPAIRDVSSTHKTDHRLPAVGADPGETTPKIPPMIEGGGEPTAEPADSDADPPEQVLLDLEKPYEVTVNSPALVVPESETLVLWGGGASQGDEEPGLETRSPGETKPAERRGPQEPPARPEGDDEP